MDPLKVVEVGQQSSKMPRGAYLLYPNHNTRDADSAHWRGVLKMPGWLSALGRALAAHCQRERGFRAAARPKRGRIKLNFPLPKA